MRYSVKPKDQIFVQCYGFASFAKNMSKDIGNNISKSLSGRYSAVTPGDKSASVQMKLLKNLLIVPKNQCQLTLFGINDDVHGT